jgi:hypothetical protein
MADKSPLELELAKKAINAGLRMGLEEDLEYESELFAQMFTTANKEEGIGAFLGGTSPNLLVSTLVLREMKSNTKLHRWLGCRGRYLR